MKDAQQKKKDAIELYDKLMGMLNKHMAEYTKSNSEPNIGQISFLKDCIISRLAVVTRARSREKGFKTLFCMRILELYPENNGCNFSWNVIDDTVHEKTNKYKFSYSRLIEFEDKEKNWEEFLAGPEMRIFPEEEKEEIKSQNREEWIPCIFLDKIRMEIGKSLKEFIEEDEEKRKQAKYVEFLYLSGMYEIFITEFILEKKAKMVETAKKFRDLSEVLAQMGTQEDTTKMTAQMSEVLETVVEAAYVRAYLAMMEEHHTFLCALLEIICIIEYINLEGNYRDKEKNEELEEMLNMNLQGNKNIHIIYEEYSRFIAESEILEIINADSSDCVANEIKALEAIRKKKEETMRQTAESTLSEPFLNFIIQSEEYKESRNLLEKELQDKKCV